MIFREATKEEIHLLYQEGYQEWSKNRSFEQYCLDNSKDDAVGTRYIIEKNGEIVSSLVLIRLNNINGMEAYGLGSIVTSKIHRGNGYSMELIKRCINRIPSHNTVIFLYSEINPHFYEKLGFRILSDKLQKYDSSVCMAYCEDDVWDDLLSTKADVIPNYF